MEKMRKGIIYKYTNKIDGKVYIGRTINTVKRLSAHRNHEHQDSHHRIKFYDALDEYGIDNFDYEVLVTFWSKNKANLITILDTLEMYYIRQYKANDPQYGYNVTEGGSGVKGLSGEKNPFYGRHHTDETKKMISQSNKGRKQSAEAIEKRREKMIGHAVTDETRDKIGKSNSKSVSAYKGDTLIGTWLGYKNCAKALGLPSIKGISKVVRGHLKSFYGYTFTR